MKRWLTYCWRTGRRNAHTIYVQRGPRPTDRDPFVGSCVTGQDALRLVKAANGAPAPRARGYALAALLGALVGCGATLARRR